MCTSKIIQAEVIGYTNDEQQAPCVLLYFVDDNKKVHRMDTLLLEHGLAKTSNTDRMISANSSIIKNAGIFEKLND